MSLWNAWPLALCSTAAFAQAPAWFELKPDLRAALAAKGDAKRGAGVFELCEACHRKDGAGRAKGNFPALAGQHASVLMKQLADIRAGRRFNPVMQAVIDDPSITAQDVADVAAYAQSLPVRGEHDKGPGKALAPGKRLYERDCASCHGAAGQGQAAQFYPRVAAQHYPYLVREVQMIRDGQRRNSHPEMVAVVKRYSVADIEAVADYMAQFPVPGK
ncbi:MAG: c-type cytochrome [Rubrivivax sp.]|nr:c-type cytochrome [Rubrivivax sp.]